MKHEIWLMRHGETLWSISGQHTGRTDLALTAEGERLAATLKPRLRGREFALVLSSPMQRAITTCRLAGLEPDEITKDLCEWDYGDYEGLTTPEIQRTNPGWTIWTGTPPNGESAAQVAERADRLIERALKVDGDSAFFAHGHFLRVLGARWIEQDPSAGGRLLLSTGSVCVLGWERNTRAIKVWNQT